LGKKKETLTFNSAKVEKENKSTEDSDVDHDTPKKKDRKKMQNDHTLTVSSKKVEKEDKSTEDSDVELGSPKKKDRKKMI
jgi:adenylate cyclase class IV